MQKMEGIATEHATAGGYAGGGEASTAEPAVQSLMDAAESGDVASLCAALGASPVRLPAPFLRPTAVCVELGRQLNSACRAQSK